VVVKSSGKLLAMGGRGVAFQCKRDALKNFDYDSFTARSHFVIKQAKERLVALNEMYSSKKGEYCKMSKEDKFEQHDDVVGDSIKKWVELIQSKEAEAIGLADGKQNTFHNSEERKMRKNAKALIESMFIRQVLNVFLFGMTRGTV
jgi:hypothetical protein